MTQAFDTTNWRMNKIITLEKAAQIAEQLRTEGKKIVTVNGSFDLFHVGHLDQLEEAKQQGDVLFVGLNSDQSIKNEKGDNRPLIPEPARAAMLAALICTDYIMVLDVPYNDLPAIFLRAIKPDIHANGGDRGEPQTWIEWPVMQEVGAEGFSVTHRNPISTSAILEKIKKSS